MATPARIAVVGVGGIGGYVAGEFARAGQELVLCARSPFDALEVEAHGETRRIDAAVLTDPAQASPADWVLLVTKAHQTAEAAPWLEALCGEGTRAIAVLQNGAGHEERVRPFARGVTVLPALVRIAAEALAPGRIVHRQHSSLVVPDPELAAELGSLAAGSHLEIEHDPDFDRAVWWKLCTNAAGSPLSTLTDRTLEVFGEPEIADLGRRLVLECIAVARAQGIELDDGLADTIVAGMTQLPPGTGSSMLTDRRKGRPLEHEAITGTIVRLGREYGVPTPLSETVLALLRAIDADLRRAAG